MHDVLTRLGLEPTNPGAWAGSPVGGGHDGTLQSLDPSDNTALASVDLATLEQYETVVSEAARAFKEWRMLPAPHRGEIVRQMGDAMRAHKADLGALESLEVGKIRAEGQGEVQESIDIADFSVGLSRQLYGLTMHSERPRHRMYEQWHPLGVELSMGPYGALVWGAYLLGRYMLAAPPSRLFATG